MLDKDELFKIAKGLWLRRDFGGEHEAVIMLGKRLEKYMLEVEEE